MTMTMTMTSHGHDQQHSHSHSHGHNNTPRFHCGLARPATINMNLNPLAPRACLEVPYAVGHEVSHHDITKTPIFIDEKCGALRKHWFSAMYIAGLF